MLTPIINAYRKAWGAAKTIYHTAAFVALVFVGWSIHQGHTTGYAQTLLPFGTTINQVDATQLTDNAAKPAKQPTRTATADPLPQHSPIAPPPTPAQVK